MKAKSGLDLEAKSGAECDAFAVACTATMLHARRTIVNNMGTALECARHAVALHRLSGQLHRIAERQCNEDFTCRECDGSGEVTAEAVSTAGMARGAVTFGQLVCRSCAGTGSMLGKREARIERQAKEIAAHYGLMCYFQGDPRGCSLYLIDPADVPMPETAPEGKWLDGHVSRWISYNYTRGHAVVRLGR